MKNLNNIVKNPFEIASIWEQYRNQMNRRQLRALPKYRFVRHFTIYANLYKEPFGYIAYNSDFGMRIPSHVVIYDNKKFISWVKAQDDLMFIVPKDLGAQLKRLGYIEIPIPLEMEFRGEYMEKSIYIKPNVLGLCLLNNILNILFSISGILYLIKGISNNTLLDILQEVLQDMDYELMSDPYIEPEDNLYQLYNLWESHFFGYMEYYVADRQVYTPYIYKEKNSYEEEFIALPEE